MENKKKYIIWGVVILLILVVLYFVFKKKAVAKKAQQASINADAFPLKKGSSGNEVAMLQRYLLKEFDANALPSYGADGKWGDETDAAVTKYLKKDSVSLDSFTKLSLNNY